MDASSNEILIIQTFLISVSANVGAFLFATRVESPVSVKVFGGAKYVEGRG